MEKAIIYLFSSPTCPNCPNAKRFIQEFKKERDDFILKEMSTATKEGSKKAKKYGIMSVPTFIIKGPNYPQVIGLKGVQSKKSMNKYLDLSFGITKEEEKISLKNNINKFIKQIKMRFSK